jgi:hypothetical protein
MPTLGVALNLLYKLQSGTNYLIAGQYTAGSIDAIIDDLTPGAYYTIAVQAFSAFGIGSTVRVVTGTDALAPSNTTAPGVPSAFTHVAGNNSAYARPPSMLGTLVGFSCRHNWTAPTDKDLVGYEWVTLGTTGTDPVGNGNFSPINEAISVLSGPVTSYLYVRSKNRSGVFSAWVTDSVNLNTSHLQPAGDMMLQSAGTVAITGGTAALTSVTISDGSATLASARAASLIVAPAAATSPRAQLALYAGSEAFNFTVSSGSYDLDVDITNRGFTAKPDWGLIQIYDTNYLGVYDFDNGSTITVARFVIYSRDGGTRTTGNRRYHFILGKYT